MDSVNSFHNTVGSCREHKLKEVFIWRGYLLKDKCICPSPFDKICKSLTWDEIISKYLKKLQGEIFQCETTVYTSTNFEFYSINFCKIKKDVLEADLKKDYLFGNNTASYFKCRSIMFYNYMSTFLFQNGKFLLP